MLFLTEIELWQRDIINMLSTINGYLTKYDNRKYRWKSVITSEVQATAVNLTSDKPSRTQRALTLSTIESKVDNSEITKASSGQNNHPNKNRSDNVTSDGIEALKPYEI